MSCGILDHVADKSRSTVIRKESPFS